MLLNCFALYFVKLKSKSSNSTAQKFFTSVVYRKSLFYMKKGIFKYFGKDVCYLVFQESKEINVDDIEKIEISLKLCEIK